MSIFLEMIATVPFIKQKFDEFNELMFDGKLPPVAIKLSKAKRYIGMCAYRTRKEAGKAIHYDFVLRISVLFDLSRRVLEDTIIHEMIHYCIAYNQIDDKSSHGAVFRSYMNRINDTFGRNVVVSHKSSMKIVDRRRRWHVVAVADLGNGKTGVKVLPRIIQRITYFYNNMLASKEISGIKLYLTDDPFFNQLPNSSALKLYIYDADTIEKHLQGAESLSCNGRTISSEQHAINIETKRKRQ